MVLLLKVRVQMCFMKKMENYLLHRREIFYRALQEQQYLNYVMNWVFRWKKNYLRTDELKEADAAFFCGTAAEVIGWESLDDSNISKNRGMKH